MSAQHADDRATLKVADVIEYLVDLESIPDEYFDWMGVSDRVELESCLERFRLCHGRMR